jgi:hypothetical protein
MLTRIVKAKANGYVTFIRGYVRMLMMDDTRDDWADRAKRLLKVELKRADVSYEELATRLTAIGVPETKGSITVKISRGGFPLWFFLAAMKAIGREHIRIDDA